MEFYTVSREKRPVRLPEELRQWAWDSLQGVYGDDAQTHPYLPMDDIPGLPSFSRIDKYDLSIRRIAECAPLRLCPNEPCAGSATLGGAIGHMVPTSFDGKPVCRSVSHLTINYRQTLQEGLVSYERALEVSQSNPAHTPFEKRYLQSVQNVLESIHILHSRYLSATKDANPEIHKLLQRVPFQGARNFREAVQSLWFVFSFCRLCGNWPGIGRIDWLLGDYLKKDLSDGTLTLDEAREILAGFFIKGCEWIQSAPERERGDAQHYQNIVLAGIDETGRDITNEVTYLVLDIVEELPIGDFPITVRLNPQTPEKLYRRIAEVMRHGGGIVAVYNEPVILEALKKAGYPDSDAVQFANDGCWEVQIPGKTCFRYMPFDGLQVFDRSLEQGLYPDMESLYHGFLKELRKEVQYWYDVTVTDLYEKKGNGWHMKDIDESTVVSLFTDGCMESAHNYFDLGSVYTVRSPHIGGVADIANSLYAFEELVFKRREMSYSELLSAIREDWQGRELQRRHAHDGLSYYGNDNDDCDKWAVRITADFAKITAEIHNSVPLLFVPGISTFGRQVDWLPDRRATAFGTKKGDILSSNSSPTPGTDTAGATAIIKSCCKLDHTLQTTGDALDLKLLPSCLRGEDGIIALTGLIKGFLTLGGYFMQIDTMDASVLRDAQLHPENHKTLSVRVSGWNARFVTLDENWQRLITERTEQGL